MGDDTKTEKVSGYLEKKGKLKVMCSWKKYWFVLEGRLLLYYRSKLEYDLISPCKGSINLGPPCSLKSCPSVPGAFQIETRSSTVTLRSENRAEQNRWMQAIMLALNQHPSPTKLTHFRYSLDSLVPNSESNKETAKVETPLERQNTMPERLKTQYPKRKKQIIQRLQKLGAHSYGGSLGTINKSTPHQRMSGDYTENESHIEDEDAITKADEYKVESRTCEASSSPSSPEKSPDPCLECMQENEHYATARGLFVDKSKEEKQDCILENPQYISTEKINKESVEDIQERDKNFLVENNIYERISGESNDSTDPERPGNFMVGNDNYSIPIKKSSPSKSSVEEMKEDISTAGERNCIAEKRKSLQRQDATVISENDIYSEPKLEEITDQNDNNVTIENVDYISIDDRLDAHEVEYECLDKTVIETANHSPTSVENKQALSDQNSSDTKQKHKSKYTLKNIIRRNSKEDKSDKNDRSLRKSSSFIKKVWKRRGKRIKETEDKEDIYEEIDRGGREEKKAEGEIQNTVVILTELANILEAKKSKLKEKLLQNFPAEVDIHSPPCERSVETEQEGGEDKEGSTVSYLVPDEVCPELPKKANLSKNVSPYHDVPANNQPIIIPKQNKTKQRQQSLDEILDDLNKQESQKEKRSNVKELIEKFDDNDGNKCDVVLRRMQRSESDKTPYRHSDELDKLLDELTKVTTAPVMKPGVTSSLLTPKRTDEEWLKLLPIRKRRLSEPDYDVPRSHRSLLTMSSKDEGEKEITGTRFFGPVIGPCDQKDEGNSSSSSVCSMTPDSLEPLIDNEERNNKIRDPPPSDISYTSHTYPHSHHKNIEEVLLRSTAKELKCHTYNCRKQNSKSDDKIIYAQPKIIRSRKIYDSQAKFIDSLQTKSQDMFIDSLEQCTEISTAF